MEGRRMNNLAAVLFTLFLAFVAAPENTDIGYATMSIGSHSAAELVIRGGSDYLEVGDEK
jgi:hypothetical protein